MSQFDIPTKYRGLTRGEIVCWTAVVVAALLGVFMLVVVFS